MAKLGSPQTTKFSIGTAELRVGVLQKALKLVQGNSVGLIDNATVEVTQESVDLNGGFPKVLVDTAVVSQEATITATLREYSRRNLQLMLGEGVVDEGSEPADVATTLDAAGTSGATTLSVTDETGFADNTLIVTYPAANPAAVQILRMTGSAAGSITLAAETPLIADVSSGDVVYAANEVSIGAISETNYFSVQLLQLERATGRPIGFDFWKGAIGAGMTFGTNAEDFASTELNIKLLQPAESEYAAGQTPSAPLDHLVDLIPSHPTGVYYGGGD